jgi:8-oxo-dGTP pyrophosphatase MutT (NUDIX family)
MNGNSPGSWLRDTAPLDLARLFHQALHKGRITTGEQVVRLTSHGAQDLLNAFARFVDDKIRHEELPFQLETISLPNRPAPFHQGLRLTLGDRQSQPLGRYLVLAKESTAGQLPGHAVSRVREMATMGFEDGSDPKAVILLQGVHTADRYDADEAVSLHDPGRTPIHVVRLTLGQNHLRIVRIVHAIIPARLNQNQLPCSLLFTLSPDDECARLPGGKIESNESPAEALVRELGEELELLPEQLESMGCLFPDGLNDEVESPSSGRLTIYMIYPFLVKVRPEAVPELIRKVTNSHPKDPCKVWPERFEDWARTGLGFGTLYPNAVLSKITPELLQSAAMDLF